MGVVSGTSYPFVLNVSATVSFSVTARVTTINVSTDVSRPVEVSIQADSTGTFTASIT